MNNQEKNFEKPIGTSADIESSVNIAEVFGGYFSNPEKAKEFVTIGIEGIASNLDTKIKYVDFGGGQGFLANHVVDFLETCGHDVDAIVADANANFLDIAESRGFRTELCNLESCSLQDIDLITMRAVLHYNVLEAQQKILKNIFEGLKENGFLVHQLSSGSIENVSLRSEIVNLPSLGRAHAEGQQYRFITEEEYMTLAMKAGFHSTERAGYATPHVWGPEDQWNRFNAHKLKDAEEKHDEKTILQITERKLQYLAEANKIIERHIELAKENAREKQLGVYRDEIGQYYIRYKYPVFVSKKII